MEFSWQCPFCGHHATITENNYSVSRHEFSHGNKYDWQATRVIVTVCPNPNCREYTLQVTLHDHVQVSGEYKDLEAKQRWKLIPPAEIKVFPDYIPNAILTDYREACMTKEQSPKASATLSRRCLQGMIRDFWGVSKNRLIDEIEAIQDRVDPLTWHAIDAVRKIGNIGAHMEKDINQIVEVEPEEASLLIGLIETLINDWYITRHERTTECHKLLQRLQPSPSHMLVRIKILIRHRNKMRVPSRCVRSDVKWALIISRLPNTACS
jgi:hypothetical protein